MAEQLLTLMADLDSRSQKLMSGWYQNLREAGFSGTQTQGLPYHISLAAFPPDREEEAVRTARETASRFGPVPVHISHIGLFAGGRILFGGPEKDEALAALRKACRPSVPEEHPWTPHVTVLIDEPEIVHAALPFFVKAFTPFEGTITRLHLCAFWPTREILTAEMGGGK